ncbi:hypothetical protein Cgig2_011240 [Carnegiea gigantea]|uniref:Autophagy-related protein n=1 Tax=Carnegiea gigantea TaxID=171969 RepID=A0A9Q1QHF9_9CARY|nr:hypothetical protein Cgig2_011240 [Carnegiea gigantea]
MRTGSCRRRDGEVAGEVGGGRGSSHGSGLGRLRGLGQSVRRLAGLFGDGHRRAATDGERPATGRLALRTPETLNGREGYARDVRRAENSNSTSGSASMAKSSFKAEHPLEKRQAEAVRIREKFPDRIPVIVEKAERTDIPDIDKKKYLVPADLTVGQFVYVIRKRVNLSPEKAIFVFVKNTLPPTAALMSTIYEENKDEDGFLYLTYSGENVFGSMQGSN